MKSLIEIERTIIDKNNKKTTETTYFISSLPTTVTAKTISEGIRGHWKIESFHYIKDVIFGEDKWKVKTKNAPANYSLIRNIVLNIFRHNGFDNIQETVEKCANNIVFMMAMMSLI